MTLASVRPKQPQSISEIRRDDVPDDLCSEDLDLVVRRGVALQSVALWLYDFDAFAITWANAAALELWSAANCAELAARNFKAEMSETVAKRLDQYREDFRQNASRVFHESWTLYPREHPVLIDCRFHCHEMADGRICALIEGTPKLAIEAETQRGIDALLHSQVMTALFAENGVELYANRVMREALGPGPLAFGHGFVDPSRSDAFRIGLEMSGRHRDTVEVETVGGIRWYDIQAARCRDAATGDRAFHISATDVTQQRAHEHELMQARDHAKFADQSKSEFVASMSHEMRTPMNGVLGMLELLSYSDTNEAQSKQIEVARACGMALLELIEDVLDLSSVELNAIRIDRAVVDLPELAARVTEGLYRPAMLKGLDLRYELGEGVKSPAIGDNRRLGQLMRNLISNAIKYTTEGSVTLKLERRDADLLRIEVRDTGPGVPEDQRERIFEKFRRGDGQAQSGSGGVGLGLAICKEIVTLMDGQIGVHSAPGGGAVFWLEVPGVFDVPTRGAAESSCDPAFP